VGLIGVGVAALLVSVLLRRGVKPLQAVAVQAGAIDEKTLSARFATNGVPKELEPICKGLNHLMARESRLS
jgi:two-component system sensor histidine kinase QseC